MGSRWLKWPRPENSPIFASLWSRWRGNISQLRAGAKDLASPSNTREKLLVKSARVLWSTKQVQYLFSIQAAYSYQRCQADPSGHSISTGKIVVITGTTDACLEDEAHLQNDDDAPIRALCQPIGMMGKFLILQYFSLECFNLDQDNPEKCWSYQHQMVQPQFWSREHMDEGYQQDRARR